MNDHQHDRETGARVVVIGGGTGIRACLKGIKRHTDDLSAIVTVADDGGSSGRLRKDYRVLPPGDIRNCLVALADGDPLLQELFNYRFEDAILRGHSFGNLFLVVLTRLTGDFRAAVERARQLLGVRARVIPSTDTRVVLVAGHPDGTKSTGEQCISRCGKAINSMELRPTPPRISDEIAQVIGEADLIVVGPGSLYTSLIPNLLVPGMTEAIKASSARVVLVANLMTQPGETEGYSLDKHVRELREVGGLDRLDAVVVDTSEAAEAVRTRYAESGAEIIQASAATQLTGDTEVIAAEVASLVEGQYWRHDPELLADALVRLLKTPRKENAS